METPSSDEALLGITEYWVLQEEFAINALHYATAQKNMFMDMYAVAHPELFTERQLVLIDGGDDAAA